MNLKKKFLSSRNLIPASFLVGLMMAVAGSVYATSVGSNVSVTGTLTVSSTSNLNGDQTFGDATTDVNLFTGTLQASTTALFTNGLTSYSNVGIGTSTPAQLLSVQGGALISGTTTVGSLVATSTLFVGNGGSLFNVMQGGQVGIGSTSPGSLLALTSGSSYMNFVPAGTSTLSQGLRINAGCFQLADGSCTALSGANGSSGRVSFWTSIGALSADSNFFWDNTNKFLGIGTTTPAQLLSVQGGALISGTTTVGSLVATSTLFVGNTGNLFNVMQGGQIGHGTTSPSAKFAFTGDGTGATRAFVIADSANIERISILNNGFLGIGTTSPAQLLSVQGGALISGTTTVGSLVATSTLFVGNTGNLFNVMQGGQVGIGSTSPSAKFAFTGDGTGATRAFVIADSANIERISVLNNGFVGHSSTSPWGFLSVEMGSANPAFVVSDYGTSTPSLLVSGNGNVGMGTSSPGGFTSIATGGSLTALLLSNTGTGYTFWAEDVANDASPFVIDAAGNVGIGTTTPSVALGVQGDVLLSGTTTAQTLIATSTLYVGNGGSKLRVEEGGNVGIGSTSPGSLLGISGVAGAGITNTGAGSSFYVNDAANDTSPFMIDGAGNTGIGTSTPGQELSVVGDVLASSAATTSLIIKSTASLVGGCIQLQATDGTWIRIYATTTPTGLAGGAQNLVVQAGACQ